MCAENPIKSYHHHHLFMNSEFTSGISAMQRPVSASRKLCKDSSSCQLFAMEFPLCCRTAYRSIRLLLVHKPRIVLREINKATTPPAHLKTVVYVCRYV